MSALRKNVDDLSVAAAKRFTRECLAPQAYRMLTGEFAEGPGQRRVVFKAASGLQVIIATGPASSVSRFKGKEHGNGAG